MQIRERLPQYAYLMRLDRPIGILLLLWPTLWALWLAGVGQPDVTNFLIFIAGVILMRSAGCVVNDFADRNIDGHVARTKNRPLVSGKVTVIEALVLAFVLCTLAFLLVLLCNPLTIGLAFVGAILMIVYPLMKRFTYLPQVGLGVAFSWGVPMAFAAQTGSIGVAAWSLFFASIVWPIIYDTLYAMVDREDDVKIGVKSTAVLFHTMSRLIIGLLQALFVVLLIIVGLMFQLRAAYYCCLFIVCLLFLYQQWLIKERNTEKYFSAFLNNNLVGFAIFIGILTSHIQ